MEPSTRQSLFRKDKLEKEAKKNWDLFYKRNGNRFFKDRHWTTHEFNELLTSDGEEKIILEIGCGVGNFAFPLIEEVPRLFVYGCDFSPVAIKMCQENPINSQNRSSFFVADLTSGNFHQDISEQFAKHNHHGADIASLIFVLSAITPEKHGDCIKNIYESLKPGGILIFRDYAVGDHAMTRFDIGSKLAERFYVRQDGTRAYYFDKDRIQELFVGLFEILELDYVKRKTTNVKEKIDVDRTFIQAKLKKPLTHCHMQK